MTKKLYKSATDRKICGVCAGLGEYFGIDATIVRLIWLALSLTGTGILIYIVSAIIIPEDPMSYDYTAPRNDDVYHDTNRQQ